MDSDRSSDGKRSNDYSTAAPYIIPAQIMDQSKNLRTMIYKDKSQYESKVSLVDNYFVRTKYDNVSSDTATQYELRPSLLKPKIPNKLNLQLPRKQKVTIKRYVGEQKETQQKVTGLFSKFFKCCVDPQIQKDYLECDYCQHRQYNKDGKRKHEHQQSQRQQQHNDRYQTQPYISYRRIGQREKQPVQVFYQQITNEDVQNSRYGDRGYYQGSRLMGRPQSKRIN